MTPLAEALKLPDVGVSEATDTWERDRRRALATEVWRGIPEGSRLLNGTAHPDILAAVKAWQWGSGSLALLGRSGVGKTTAAVKLVRHLLTQAVRTGEHWNEAKLIRWVKAADIANAPRHTKLGMRPEILDRCDRARLLIIDDLGLERATDGSLGDVLKARYDLGYPTIVTSHLRWAELRERYGAQRRWFVESVNEQGKFVEVF